MILDTKDIKVGSENLLKSQPILEEGYYLT